MAKKKVSQSALPKQDEFSKAHKEVKPAMDSEASEKIESLKSLNQMLLKETFERRRQVFSLDHSKGCLEKELTRTNSEMEGLESELTRLAESAARLELQRAVEAVFVGVELGLTGETIEREMGELKRVIGEREREIGRLCVNLSEVERVLGGEREVSKRACLERDEIKCKLDLQMEEDRGLRSNLVESKERKGVIERALVDLRADYDGLVGEKGEMEVRIERISGEKDSVERCLVESNKLIEEMKENARLVLKEKEVLEEEKTAEIVKRRELENDVTRLHEMVAGLQKEEVKLLSIVAELEKKCFLGEERQKEMVEENMSSEEKIKHLAADKTTIERDLREALNRFKEEKRKIEAMVNDNIMVVEAKGRLESEVSALKKQVVELQGVVSKLEESGRVEVAKIKSLESEVGDYKCNFELLEIERGEMKNLLDEEKATSVSLMEKIGALEDKIGERVKVYEKVKAEKASIFAEKVQLENRCGMLKKEITRLEDTITEARKEFDGMKCRAETTALVLKETAAAFCSSDDVGAAGGEEVKKVGVVELEMIKNAFNNRESRIDNMRKQIELLHKKKMFWTFWSSATTLLTVAALSLSYVARGH